MSRASRIVLVASIGLLSSLLMPSAHAAESSGTKVIRRFALIIGVNDGGSDRLRLRYATTDAEAFSTVMKQLGGVMADDELLLINPDKTALEDGFVDLRNKLMAAKSPDRRLEAIFYYSGHSDEKGLLIGDKHVPYKYLRDAMKRLPADIRLAVVDSCSSGALTREKGGKRRPPFLVDASSQLKGHAFLTSSSATEAAQESDRIAASFFTHYLVSGLRGAADVSGDGRVTLTEAYQFAFHETLERTEGTKSGAQHPNYDIDLSGSGDLVITDLRGTSAALVLEKELAGRLYVRDSAGRLVVELHKLPNRAVELGLEPGNYQVTLDRKGVLSRARLSLSKGSRVELREVAFVQLDPEPTVARGNARAEEEAELQKVIEDGHTKVTEGEPDDVAMLQGEPDVEKKIELQDGADLDEDGELAFNPDDYDIEQFSFTVLPTISGSERKVLKRASINLFAGYADRVHGFEIGTGVNIVNEEMRGPQLSALLNIVRGRLRGVQLAGAANVVGGGVRGGQLAGAVNFNNGPFTGVQAAGALNINNGTLNGIQMAGAANLQTGDVHTAVQLAGAANLVWGNFRGVQVSGALNLAHSVAGAQIGVLNIGGDITGAQIGVINVAWGKVKGTQVGVINYASEYIKGVPIGLLSFVKDSSLHLDLWGSDMAPLNASFRLDLNDSYYTLLTVGYKPGRDDENVNLFGRGNSRLAVGFGVGAAKRLNEFMVLRIDTTLYNIFHGDRTGNIDWSEQRPTTTVGPTGETQFEGIQTDLNVVVRARVDFDVFDHLGLFAGIGVNNYLTWNPDRDTSKFTLGLPDRSVTDGNFTARWWPSLFVGMHI